MIEDIETNNINEYDTRDSSERIPILSSRDEATDITSDTTQPTDLNRISAYHDYEGVRFSRDDLTSFFDELKLELRDYGILQNYRIYTDLTKDVQRDMLYSKGEVIHVPNGTKNRVDFRITIDEIKFLIRQIEVNGLDPSNLFVALAVHDQDFIELAKEIKSRGVNLILVKRSDYNAHQELEKYSDHIIDVGEDKLVSNHPKPKLKPSQVNTTHLTLEGKVAHKIIELVNQEPVKLIELSSKLQQQIPQFSKLSQLSRPEGKGLNYGNYSKFIRDHPLTKNEVKITGPGHKKLVNLIK